MEVRLPRLGEGADTGAVASIFVKVGDRVEKDQPILELESEKAVATIPSPGEGIVASVNVKEGEMIKVGHLLLTLSGGGNQPAAAPATPRPSAQVGVKPRIDASVGDEEAGRMPAPMPSGQQAPPAYQPLSPGGPPPAAAPSIRKMARELGIDLHRVQGSERGGRIVLADVHRYIEWLQGTAFAAARSAAPAAPTAPAPVDFAKWGIVERKKMTLLRSTISGRMVGSWTSIPHITQFDEADITDLLALRKKFAAAYEQKGAHLTLTAFALKVLAGVLAKHPIFNASIDEAAGEIVFKKYFHAGIAVDTEQGLIVPVIRNVETKSLLELATELNTLAERTRQRKVSLEEMQGGSFTISNQGGIGSRHFTPIINKPEAAILGMGKGMPTPVVRGKEIVQRTLLPLCLSYDHRIIDGADAARFMVDLVTAFSSITESEVRLS